MQNFYKNTIKNRFTWQKDLSWWYWHKWRKISWKVEFKTSPLTRCQCDTWENFWKLQNFGAIKFLPCIRPTGYQSKETAFLRLLCWGSFQLILSQLQLLTRFWIGVIFYVKVIGVLYKLKNGIIYNLKVDLIINEKRTKFLV